MTMTDRYENKCKFDIAWVGRCNAVTSQGDFCDTHLQKKCWVCGSQADHECSHTGQFVCGAPLCPSCEGYEDSDKPRGTWGLMNHRHRRRGASND